MRLAVLTGFACLTGVGLGCGDNRPIKATPDAWLLSAPMPSVVAKPGETLPISFKLSTAKGVAIPGQRIEFGTLGGGDLAGATLSGPAAPTDLQGMATVNLIAGLAATFAITAHHRDVVGSAEVEVMVTDANMVTLSVVPQVDPGSGITTLDTVDLLLFQEQVCASFSWFSPPVATARVRAAKPGVATELRINRTGTTSVLGLGRDAKGVRVAIGCLDIPGSTAFQSTNPTVTLTLSTPELTPASAYDLSSHFSLSKSALAERIAAPWQDMADCPLDPSQIWLDCAIDALGAPPGDPFDCVPAPTGEGELADALTARRAPLPNGSACRPAKLADGSDSLDAKLAALFPNPAQSPAKSLVAIADFAAHMLDDFTLNSTLDLNPTGTPGVFSGTHTLRTAVLSVGGQPVSTDILAQGIPQSQARLVGVTVAKSTLTVEEHGLGLRLGTLSRTAFETATSLRLGTSTDVPQLVTALFALASAAGANNSRKTGCDAVDAVLCQELGRAQGCLRAACVAGQNTLIDRLNAGFASADGDGADMQLTGTTTMSDRDNDGTAEDLGPLGGDQWLARFRSQGPVETATGHVVGTKR